MNQDWVNDWYLLCAAADIAPGTVGRRVVGPHNLAVFNIDGDIFAAADACNECRTAISEGAVTDDVVECKGCGGAFKIVAHELRERGEGDRLATYPVMVVDEEIFAWIENGS
jgi:3-phenylpropionate/trans-cinnamate dioxygenase ferredoxin subunit